VNEQVSSFDADFDVLQAMYLHPFRGSVLSDQRLYHDKKISRARLRQDAISVRWRFHWCLEDLINYREWGKREADESNRLRHRLEEVFGLLNGEQREEMRRRDALRAIGIQT
jgi:hypothetical protein